MAKVNLKNVRAERVFWDGKGLAVVESETIKGQEYKTYWSIFFNEPHNIEPGTILSVEGKLGAKIDEYPDKMTGQPRTKINLTVNFPTVTDVHPGGVEFLTQAGAVELENAPF